MNTAAKTKLYLIFLLLIHTRWGPNRLKMFTRFRYWVRCSCVVTKQKNVKNKLHNSLFLFFSKKKKTIEIIEIFGVYVITERLEN